MSDQLTLNTPSQDIMMNSRLLMIPALDEVTVGSSNDTSTKKQGSLLISSRDQNKFKMPWLKPRRKRVQITPSPFKAPKDIAEEMALPFAPLNCHFSEENRVYSTPKTSHVIAPSLILAPMIPDTPTERRPLRTIKLRLRPRRQGLSNAAHHVNSRILEDRAKTTAAPSIIESPLISDFVFNTPEGATK